MKWADERVLAAVSGSATTSASATILTKLDHIYRAEAVWLGRVLGQPAKIADIEIAASLEDLRRLWPPVLQAWVEWAFLADETGWSSIVPFEDSAGNSWRLPPWQIVMHVVNHGSYHRGQVSMMMRDAGVQPPATDLVIFYHGLS